MSALEWYAHKSLGDGIFWIQERFYESGNRANIWLVRGSEQDVVIDTGLGLRSLPEYLYSSGLLQDRGAKEDEARRPLLAVATHVHFDHSGGLYQFDQVAVHHAEAEALARGDNFETVTWLSDSEVVRAPSPGWRARQFRVQAVQPTLVLQDGKGPGARAVAEGGPGGPPGLRVACLRGGGGFWWCIAEIPLRPRPEQKPTRPEPRPPPQPLCRETALARCGGSRGWMQGRRQPQSASCVCCGSDTTDTP